MELRPLHLCKVKVTHSVDMLPKNQSAFKSAAMLC
jgi:hypothetical protein